ncbi:hypothetical protein MSMTP_0195 [Methanosarcina sp. MTP4]|uniref:DUF1673 family protein n=1 Tax=Methanosarcina sp. MTP4 TaxID=1434100 RepID=UPI0006160703|nr:DUF1673 family protein [Methanosarcina sp. MTP4]AKB23664.1 hypothetical protein MSMTP_0195 [Methanosarcina sp. MTP4]
MPAKAAAFEQIKKLMGWCPACQKIEPEKEQTFFFANQAAVSGKMGNSQDILTSNVTFPANTSLFVLLFTVGFNVLLRVEDFSLFLAGLVLLNAIYCWLALKTFNTVVRTGSKSLYLRGFRLKDFEIPYEEIESVGAYNIEKRSKKSSLILCILGGIALCVALAYPVLEGDWRPVLLIISIFPIILFLLAKQKSRYRDLNTRLYIKTRHKKWYEWTPYYSLITDEASAAALKSLIERHSGRR